MLFWVTSLWGQVAPDQSAANLLPSSEARDDGPSFWVSSITFELPQGVKDFPSADQLGRLSIVLGNSPDGLAVPPDLEKEYRETELGEHADGMISWNPVPTVPFDLGNINNGAAVQIHASGLWAIEKQIANALNTGQGLGGRKFIGVFVSIDANDIGSDWIDRRAGAATELHMVIQLGRVSDVRTIGFGSRVSAENRVNNPILERIRRNSPVGPTTQRSSAQTDAIRRDLIDDYVFRLNRMPGRKVDVAVSAAQPAAEGQPPNVELDYLITETKPWEAYVQESNTGTRETGEWRTRVGFVDNQLTNDDDIFSIDYTVANFNTAQDVETSYELPLDSSGRLRARAYGSYQQFNASEVGLAGENFDGVEDLLGAELIYNFYQNRELFIDGIAAFRYQHFHVINFQQGVNTPLISGNGDYEIPYEGVRLDRITDPASTSADLTFLEGITGDNTTQLSNLGRIDPTAQWTQIQINADQSVYIEPVLHSMGMLKGDQTLANELDFSAHYQEPFGARLIPELEGVAGGMFSVRGYPESAVAGDRTVIGSAEYRFHLPRALGIQPTPGTFFGDPFRYAPQQAYGRTDWDLIFSAFIDAGDVEQSGRQSYETNATLVGTGVGVEFMVRQNLDVRADWGVALRNVDNGINNIVTRAGDSRFHVMATLAY